MGSQDFLDEKLQRLLTRFTILFTNTPILFFTELLFSDIF